MTMIIAHPELYAAAYPICPATQSANVSDETIESLKDLPIWFTHAKNDSTVAIATTTEPLVERLRAAGAEVHTSIFDDVHDTTGRFSNEDGTPYQYDGHWSWTYFDNNECYDENGVNAWQWLAKQIKTAAPVETPDQPTTPDQPANSVKTGDDVNFAGLGAIMMLTLAGIYVSRRKYN